MIIPICECGKNCKKRGASYTKTCCSKSCISVLAKKFKHSKKSIEIIRKKRFEYLLKKNGNTAWENKNNGKMSFLEKWFNNVVLNNKLEYKYDIIYNYPIYPYFIDFAFTNIKLAVEMDGKQHFINGKERIIHDIKKDNFLIKNNWKVFRIKYDEINKSTEKKFLSFLSSINTKEIKVYGNNLYTYSSIKKKHKKWKDFLTEYRKSLYIKNKAKINKIENSDIDFSKFGWVKKVSILLHIPHGKVNVWMKKYMKEFYYSKCFIRNTGVVEME